MITGLGTMINSAAIVIGGLLGLLFGGLIHENHQETLNNVCGISVLFIGIAGAMEGMLRIENISLVSGKSMFVVICLAMGSLLGEILNIEGWFERFGKWLKIRSGNTGDPVFVNAFVTASLTVCIGAMAIIGAIQDGILGDFSILAIKSILDLIIIMVMTCSMGRGCIFSAIPVFLLEGSVTLLAGFIRPVMTETALQNLSLIGSILIFCVGLNLLWGKKFRVANMLPSILFAVAAAFIPAGL